MKRISVGLVVAVLFGAAVLFAQASMEITFTVPADTVAVVKQVLAKRQRVDPTTITDLQARNGILAFCRDAVQAEVRVWRRSEDKAALDVLFNDLTEEKRAQVRAYILSLK
jgi:hypothetical protein